MPDLKFRTAERRDPEGAFVPVEFEALVPGDYFRLTEAGGTMEGEVVTAPQPCSPEGNWMFEGNNVRAIGR